MYTEKNPVSSGWYREITEKRRKYRKKYHLELVPISRVQKQGNI